MFRSALNWKNAWRIRIVALGCIVLLVGVGSQVLVNAVAAGSEMTTVKVTVYTRSGLMADGNVTYLGACAVSLSQFPLGTIIALYDADGTFDRQCTAEDTNSTLEYGRVDLAMPGNAAGAIHWGVRYLEAQVLRYGWGGARAGAPTPFATASQTPILPLHKVHPRRIRFKSGL